MLGINGGEAIILVLLALFIIGPERLPEYAEKLKELVKAAKRYATGATEELKETLGPEIADVDEMVRKRMQHALDDLARRRRFPVLG